MSDLIFRSDMKLPDPRWVTRHTPNPDLPAADFAPKYTDRERLALRLRERDGQIYTSHLATEQSFVYGVFEARMVFQGGVGAHSAFWLQDVYPNHIGGSEVDIVEHFGKEALWSNVYWRDEDTLWPKEPIRWRQSTKAFSPRQWHVYGVEWHPDRYIFTIDGRVTAQTTFGLSSSPKVMILSLLSSTWEHENLDRDNLSSYRTMVDWVRVRSLGLTETDR